MADMIQTTQKMTAAEYIAAYPETTQPMELIEGEVIVLATPKDIHQYVLFELALQLRTALQGKGRVVLSPSDVYFDEYNVLQPDIFFVSKDNPQCLVAEDGYWHGAPTLCVEILSPSTASRDRITKFDLYARFGVGEYWLVDVEARIVEIYVLEGGMYRRHGGYLETDSATSPILSGGTIAISELFPSEGSA